jgi:hypothetical protein
MKEKLSTSELLDVMIDVMQQINETDDATFVLKMKLINNVDFLVDQLMFEYEERNK